MTLFKAVFLAFISTLVIATTYSVAVNIGAKSQKESLKNEFQKECKVPQSYCDDSVKGVEQALNDCFTVNDRLIEINGKDLIKELSECGTNNQMLLEFINGCANDVKACAQMGAAAEEKLKTCVNELNACSDNLIDCTLSCMP